MLGSHLPELQKKTNLSLWLIIPNTDSLGRSEKALAAKPKYNSWSLICY